MKKANILYKKEYATINEQSLQIICLLILDEIGKTGIELDRSLLRQILNTAFSITFSSNDISLSGINKEEFLKLLNLTTRINQRIKETLTEQKINSLLEKVIIEYANIIGEVDLSSKYWGKEYELLKLKEDLNIFGNFLKELCQMKV